MIEESAAYSMCVKMAMPTANDPLVLAGVAVRGIIEAAIPPGEIILRTAKALRCHLCLIRSPYFREHVFDSLR